MNWLTGVCRRRTKHVIIIWTVDKVNEEPKILEINSNILIKRLVNCWHEGGQQREVARMVRLALFC